MTAVVLIDTGGANIGSVRYALERIGLDAPLSSDPDIIRAADRVILPGVGTCENVMRRLHAAGLVALVHDLRQPLLGVCVGMQILFERSEEGDVAGLGLLPGTVAKLAGEPGVRVPHMGWNRIRRVDGKPAADALLDGLSDAPFAYFVHSYAAPVTDDCVATTTHGRPFAALVQRGNVAGAQFHPERSAATGARLLENFVRGAVS